MAKDLRKSGMNMKFPCQNKYMLDVQYVWNGAKQILQKFH